MGATALCVFGAPVAHEDDPERGVRAALRIREAVAELDEADARLDLRVRIGVNTGEAVVARPGVGPQIGEAVTGDVVNTASRLQTAARAGRDPRRRHDPRRRRPRVRVARARAGAREGQGRAAGRVAGRRLARPAGRRPEAALDVAVHRTQGRDRAAPVGVPARGGGVDGPARDDHGRGRHRQDPAHPGAGRLRGRVAEPHPVAPGALPSLRRGAVLLGARRDREGRRRHPGLGLRRGGHVQALGVAGAPRPRRGAARAAAVVPRAPRGHRGSRLRGADGTSCSRRGAGGSSRSPRTRPSSSCSRTSNGPTT